MATKDHLTKSLQDSGWHLTSESIDEFLGESPNLNASSLIKKALDCDLRNIGSKYLIEDVVNGKIENFEANCVLQLVKLRNIGAPKEHETSQAAPPMYKFTLTDGVLNCNCLLLDDVQNLNLNTPPGTKILLTGQISIKSNLLILHPKNVKVLGGFVDYLVNKWKLTKNLSNHIRVGLTDTAPPPWVPFGTSQKIQVDTSKKVFEETESKEEPESTEFSKARKAVLAEAMEAKSKITKTFAQQNIDKSQIIAEAKTDTTVTTSTVPSATTGKPGKQNPKKGRRGKNRDFSDEEDYSDKKNTAKPPGPTTLFDLFKTKLNIEDDETKVEQPKEQEIENTRGGRGQNFRGNRNRRQNPRFQQPQQGQQASDSNKNKQAYNPNDFNFELGEDINLKELKNQTTILQQIKTENKEKKPENPAAAPSTAPVNQNRSEFQTNFDTNQSRTFYNNRQNNNQNRASNYNNNNNNNYNNQGNFRQNPPRQQYYQQEMPIYNDRNNRNYNQNQYYMEQQQQQQPYYSQNNDYYQNNNFRNNNNDYYFENPGQQQQQQQQRRPRNNNNNNNRNWDNNNNNNRRQQQYY